MHEPCLSQTSRERYFQRPYSSCPTWSPASCATESRIETCEIFLSPPYSNAILVHSLGGVMLHLNGRLTPHAKIIPEYHVYERTYWNIERNVHTYKQRRQQVSQLLLSSLVSLMWQRQCPLIYEAREICLSVGAIANSKHHMSSNWIYTPYSTTQKGGIPTAIWTFPAFFNTQKMPFVVNELPGPRNRATEIYKRLTVPSSTTARIVRILSALLSSLILLSCASRMASLPHKVPLHHIHPLR